ncbi:MAG: hypothetical protein MMC23_001295 [Stictis urceolatum]|nr:hypothetical protein [Stictis urceolata]
MSRVPLAPPLAMSTAQDVIEGTTNAPQPTASPLPIRPGPKNEESQREATTSSRPHPTPSLPRPKLMFEVRDLSHPGAAIFFEHAKPTKILTDALVTVLQILNKHPKGGKLDVPGVRSITLVLKPMKGVAYTTSKDFDHDHKEIHFSLDYISEIETSPSTPRRQAEEIYGVVVHEMVHVWQYNGKGMAPGGLIEGIADYVRLKAGYCPPHWKREPGETWDEGYQATGYFLDWLEGKFGAGKVEEANLKLKAKYVEKEFWKELLGKSIDECFKEYCKEMGKTNERADGKSDETSETKEKSKENTP